MARHKVQVSAFVLFSLFSTWPAPLVAQTDVARLNGRPKFSEGKAFGYFVWKDDQTIKVRWTTFGANHRFSGRVTVEDGDIQSLKRIDVDEERKVLVPGRPPRVARGPRGRVRGVAPGRAPVVATREEDRIEQETRHVIRFLTRTDDDIDGFDFKVTDGTRAVRFLLEIDGVPQAEAIEIGRDNVKPGQDPFVVRFR